MEQDSLPMGVFESEVFLNTANHLRLEIHTVGHRWGDSACAGNVISLAYSRLVYVVDGENTIWTEKTGEMFMEKGNWYLIPSECAYDFECKNTLEYFFFHVKLCDFDGIDLLKNCGGPLCLPAKIPVDRDFVIKCLHSNKLTDGLFLRQMVFDVLLSFIETYRIPIDSHFYSDCVFRALVYIKQHLSMQLTIGEIAENIFVSKSTLTKHFQKELNMSVNEYICNTIMADAERLLMTSNITVHDLAIRLGYTDQLYFSRRFREKFGKSPRDYRKQKRL